ncbi:MAG: LysR family transcriptional regulator [Blastocatellia bacterium]
MNLTQLCFVKAVSETSSFSKAAERCGVSQPSLSNSIGQLEEELGGRIFSRTTRKVGLTPFGEYLLPLLDAVLNSVDELKKSADAFQNPSHKLIRLGLSPLIDIHLLARVMEPYRRDHADVDIIFKECYLNDLGAWLLADRIDVVFALKEPRNGSVRSCPFYEEALHYLPRHATVAGNGARDPIKLDEIATESFVVMPESCGLTPSLRRLFKQRGYTLNEYLGQALSCKVVEDWVMLGIGAAILPQSKITLLSQSARPLWLEDNKAAKLVYEMRWRKAALHSPHIKAFLTHFRQVTPVMLKGLV